ncbi:MAG: AMP-binding protein [Bacillota bacterium]|nr:AMP-binding protein [Bacillota bacterium]
MKNNTLGGYKTVDAYVSAKLKHFNSLEHSFASMFEVMFSERENIIYEKSCGYKIEYATYGEACDRAVSCSNRIRKLAGGLHHDSVIGLYMENDINWIVAFWAILRSGFRPLLLNARLGDEILSAAMKSCDTRLVISDGKVFEGVSTVVFDKLMGGVEPEECCEDFGTEVLIMSSGTTSSPKICAYTPEEFYCLINDSYDIIAKCDRIQKFYEGQIKLLTFLPFYHIFGLVAVYVWFAFFARTFVHLGDYSAQTILNTIRRHKVTHIFAVPMFWNEVYKQAIKTIRDRGEETYERFCKGMDIARRIGDVPLIGQRFIRSAFSEVRENLFGESISFMITGGSEIKPEVLSFFNLIGYHLANGYGMTEIGITSVELSPKREILNKGFVGKPLTSVEYSISEEGSLLVRGGSVAKYILEDGKRLELSDWYDTRDLAECVDGHYRILGRMDDLVIAENGENLNPCLVEPLLTENDSYQLCLVGTVKDGEILPTLLVYAGSYVTAERYETVRGEILRRLQKNSLSSMIRKILFVKKPLVDAGDIKINRTRLTEQYASGSLEILDPEKIAAAECAENELADYVRALFAAALEKPAEEIGMDADFFLDEGGTSLDYFAMISKIQEDYAVSFPATQEKTMTTVRELYSFIEETLKNVD